MDFAEFRRWVSLRLACSLLLAQGFAGSAQANPFFSEYVEGSSFNKAVEVYSAGAFDLAGGVCAVRIYANGNPSPNSIVPLPGAIAAGGVYVLANASADPAVLALADQLDAGVNFNGDDAVELFCDDGTGTLDVIGEIGFDPGIEWGIGDTSTRNNTVRRNETVAGGDVQGFDPFDPATEWSGFPQNAFDDLGRFEPGDVGDPLSCTSAEIQSIGSVQGSGAATPLTGTVVVRGVVIADFEGSSPSLGGFYLQDSGDGDAATSDGIFVYDSGDDFVALGRDVAVRGTVSEFADQTQITPPSKDDIVDCGSATLPVAASFTLPLPAPVGGVDFLERFEGMRVTVPQTLLVTDTFHLGRFGHVTLTSGQRLFEPTQVAAPGAPAAAIKAANALDQLLIDDATQDQNRYPVLFPTRTPPAVSGLSPSNTVRGDDSVSNLTGVLTYTWGGSGASPNAFRIRFNSSDHPEFVQSNPRPATPPAVGGSLRVVGFNVFNYFTTIDDGSALCGPPGLHQRCRGADDANELDRQRQKVLAALARLDADVIGLVEIENNTGNFPTSAVKDLAERLNAAGGSAACASFTAVDPGGFVGDDVIQVGFVYCNDTVRIVPGTAPAVLDDAVLAGLSVPHVTLPVFNGNAANRAALAVSFERLEDGVRFTVVNNHFKSKGSAGLATICGPDPAVDPNCDQGDGQGFWNARRADAARSLVAWLATYPTGTNDPDVLIVGDLNAYAMEDPITEFADAGFTDLVARGSGSRAWSFSFGGQWGTLDYALANVPLTAQVTAAKADPINADEPVVLDYDTTFNDPALFAPDAFRASDHDPILVGLSLVGECGDRRVPRTQRHADKIPDDGERQ